MLRHLETELLFDSSEYTVIIIEVEKYNSKWPFCNESNENGILQKKTQIAKNRINISFIEDYVKSQRQSEYWIDFTKFLTK